MRKTKLVTGEFYHIYNRGVDKRSIFKKDNDLARFFQCLDEFNSEKPIGSLFEFSFVKEKIKHKNLKLVNIICYCLNPNHYHLVLEQHVDNGISEFMKRLNGGYTNYFNAKYKRSGALFQGKFKANHIDSNEYLLHVSCYVNLNNQVHKLKTNSFLSSWSEYIDIIQKGLCKKDIILNQFDTKKEYKTFAEESLNNISERKELLKELSLFEK